MLAFHVTDYLFDFFSYLYFTFKSHFSIQVQVINISFLSFTSCRHFNFCTTILSLLTIETFSRHYFSLKSPLHLTTHLSKSFKDMNEFRLMSELNDTIFMGIFQNKKVKFSQSPWARNIQ